MQPILETLSLALHLFAARSPDGVAPADLLAQLPFNERCEVATSVARKIVNVLDFVATARPPSSDHSPEAGPETTFNLFIAKEAQSDLVPPVSIFAKGEKCGDATLYRLYFLGPSKSATFGVGRKDDLPDGQVYELVHSKTTGPGRWEFSWRYGEKIWSCPRKLPPHPTVCIGPMVPSVPLPTLRIVVARDPSGGIHVESSVLEFIRTHPTSPANGPP